MNLPSSCPPSEISPLFLVPGGGLESSPSAQSIVVCVQAAVSRQHYFLCASTVCPLPAHVALHEICIALQCGGGYKYPYLFLVPMNPLSCLGFHRIFALALFGAKGDTNENCTSTAGSRRRCPTRLWGNPPLTRCARCSNRRASGHRHSLPALRVGL